MTVFRNTALTKYIPMPDTNTVLDYSVYLESSLGMASCEMTQSCFRKGMGQGTGMFEGKKTVISKSL